MLARFSDVGHVYGLAYDWRREALYIASADFHHWDVPTWSVGAIYRLDLASAMISKWAEVPATATIEDLRTFRTGLGDIELSSSGDELAVTNLAERRIERFAVPDGNYLGSFPHGASPSEWRASAMPFGLGVRGDWLFHGVVDSGLVTGETPTGYVYKSLFDGTAMEEVSSFSLDYERTPRWQAWTETVPGAYSRESMSQPVIADLEFGDGGQMVIGLTDRLSYRRDEPRNGAVLPAYERGGRYTVQVNEFYRDDLRWPESLQGALAPWPGHNGIVAISSLPDGGDGAVWLRNSDGAIHGPNEGVEYLFLEELFAGDIEAVCPRRFQAFLPSTDAGCKPAGSLTMWLTIDMSSSMLDEGTDSIPKHVAAITAASELVEAALSGGSANHVQIGVLGFNDEAWQESAPSSDRAVVLAALARLPSRIREGTRLDKALATTEASIRSSASSSDTIVSVLLTDGLPNGVPPGPDGTPRTTILAAAASLKQRTHLYTMGFGDPGDVDPDLLGAVATMPSNFIQSPTAADLARAFREIGSRVLCK